MGPLRRNPQSIRQSYISQVLYCGTHNCVYNKILNHGLLFSLFKLKILIPILFNISVLLAVQANLPETSPFFFYQNGFREHLVSNVYSTLNV